MSFETEDKTQEQINNELLEEAIKLLKVLVLHNEIITGAEITTQDIEDDNDE